MMAEHEGGSDFGKALFTDFRFERNLMELILVIKTFYHDLIDGFVGVLAEALISQIIF